MFIKNYSSMKGLYKKINPNTPGFTQINMGLNKCTSILSNVMT